MFELTMEEAEFKEPIGAAEQGENIKYLPMAFTEQGRRYAAPAILNSEQAILVGIEPRAAGLAEGAVGFKPGEA